MRSRLLHIALFIRARIRVHQELFSRACMRRAAIAVMATLMLAADAAAIPRPPKVIKTTPAQNASGTALMPDVRAMFGMDLIRSTLNDTTFIITGSRSGRHKGTISYSTSNYEASLSLSSPLIGGETVQAVLTSGGVVSALTEEPLAAGFTWTFTAGASNGTGQFTPDARALPTSGSPSAVAAADFNGDGFTDLVAANAAQKTVDVFLNTKRQQFSPPVTYALNAAPAAVACADVNGDGMTDIVTAGDSCISVLLNVGSGNFSAAVSYAAGPSVSAMFLADVDNDGAVDCAVTNASANTVTILKNDGKGAFTLTLQTIAVQGSPSGIALEDLNNDGNLDGLVCSRQSNTVTVLKNAGLAHFTADSIYTMHTAPAAIVSFDFDNDGFMDFAVANSGSGDISIMLNNAGTGFIGPGNLDLPGGHPVSLCGGDFDGDGDIDLAAACPDSNTVVIMQNNGYTFPTVTAVPAGRGAAGAAVLEMSGTYGILDVATANATEGTVSILKNAFFLPPPAELTLSADEVAFPETPADSARTFIVKLSAAFSPLTVDSVASVSGLFSSPAAMPCVIPSYGSVDLPIVFAPRSAGTFSDTLTIYSTAGASRVRVTGTSTDISVSAASLKSDVPSAWSMSQNYPNPFNPSTEIEFDVPDRADVTISVFDVTGRNVAEIFKSTVNAGRYHVRWNAQKVSSGIYFYTMRAVPVGTGALYHETRTLVILK